MHMSLLCQGFLEGNNVGFVEGVSHVLLWVVVASLALALARKVARMSSILITRTHKDA